MHYLDNIKSKLFTSNGEETSESRNKFLAIIESFSLEKKCGIYVFTSRKKQIVNGTKFIWEH